MSVSNHVFDFCFNNAIQNTMYEELIDTIITTAKLLEYKMERTVYFSGENFEFFNLKFKKENILLCIVMKYHIINLKSIKLEVTLPNWYDEFTSTEKHQEILELAMEIIINEKSTID